MVTRKLFQVQIGGADVSSKVLNYEIVEDYGNPIYDATITFPYTLTDSVTLSTSQLVEIWEGYVTATDKKVFSGYIESYVPEPGKIVVKAFNKLYAGIRTQLNAVLYQSDVVGNAVYPDGKFSDAIIDILTNYVGLNADSSTIMDSGTAIKISKFICDHTSAKERIDDMITALGWVYYYDADTDYVYAHAKQTTANSTILTIGSNVINVPKWDYNKTDMINDLRIDGAFQEQEINDVFSGTGSTDNFTLSQYPIGTVAIFNKTGTDYTTTAPLQGDLKVLGVPNQTVTYDYSVDRANRQIMFATNTISGTNNVLAKYSAKVAVPVHKVDDVSVSAYGSHERTIQLTDVISVNDARARCQNVINIFKNPFQTATLNVAFNSNNNFTVGESVQVVDNISEPNVDGVFTISKIVRKFPNGFDEITVGNRPFDPAEYYINESERLHRLERSLIGEDAILTEDRSITFSPVNVYMSAFTVLQEYANDSFIIDHYINSIVYDADEAFIVDDFETETDWTDQSSGPTLTISADSTSGHFWTGSQGTNISWSDTSGTAVIRSLESYGDFSSALGASSGTPAQGTFGFWVYTPNGSVVSDFILKIGSSGSDRAFYTSSFYSDIAEFSNGTLHLLLFDADSPYQVAGTPDWTAVANIRLEWTILGAGNITLDYFTVSKSNDISLCGIGNRSTTKDSTTYNF